MVRIYFILFLFITSCQSPTDKVIEEFKTIDSSLQKTNELLEQTRGIGAIKVVNDSTATVITKNTDELIDYINSLKEKLKTTSKVLDANIESNEPIASNKVMMEEGNSDKLFAKIEKYQDLCIATGKSDSTEAKMNDLFSGFRQNKKMQATFFKNLPTVAALTLLDKFKNDVKNCEYLTLTSQ